MRKIITSISALTALVATVSLVSCSEGSEVAEVVPANDICNISVAPTVSDATVSKAEDAGTESFTDGSTIGLAIYKSDDSAVHSYPDVYNNIKATYSTSTSTAWNYSFTSDNWTESLPQISLKTNEEACKVYGYYPFDSSVEDITAINFVASNNYQLMYGASEVTEIAGVEQKDIDLTFTQAMTRWHFVVKLANFTSYTEFYYFKFDTEAEDKLVSTATFNAKTGVFSDIEYVKTMQTPTSISTITTEGTTRDVYLVPFTLNASDDDDIKISMRYESVTTTPEYFTITEGDFAAGVSHTINVTIDNYGKIIASSIKIDETWSSETFDAVEL